MHFYNRVVINSVFLIGFLAAGQWQAYADQVILTNGDCISGRLVTLSRESLEIETVAAGLIRIDRKYVEKLSTEDAMVVDLASGERVIGQMIAGERGTVVVRSSILGERRLPLDAVDAIRPPVHSKNLNGSASTDDLQNTAGIRTDRSLLQTEKSEPPVQLSDVKGRGTGSPAAAENQATKPAETQKPKPIGQKPEDEADIRKIFLRQTSVLLRPGQVEEEVAISYLHTQSVSSILNAKFRQFRLPLATRIGLFDRAEGYITVPAAYAHRELAFADSAVSSRKFGIGDATAGFNYEIARETGRRPDIITSVGLGASTGSKPNEEGLSLGSGHWAATIGLQFIKTFDPVALFGGFNYAHQFKARYFLNDAVHTVSPGETAGYNFGFGFAVNEDISLSAQISGSYQSRTRADGVTVFGSSSEPVSLRSALTYRYSKGTYIEPSVVIGLDNDTPDFVLGFSLTHRFGKSRGPGGNE